MSDRPKFKDLANFTFDLGQMPQVAVARLTQGDQANAKAFTLSSGTEIIRVVRAFDATTRQTIADYPLPVASATNDLTLLHAGNNTHYGTVFQFYTPVDALVQKIDFNFAQGLIVETANAQNYRMTNTVIRIRSYRAQNQIAFSDEKNYNYTMTVMTVSGDNQILIMNTSYDAQFPIYRGGLLEIFFDIFAATGDDSGVWQKGLIPIFPYQNQGGLREYGTSALALHLVPNPWPDGTALWPTTFADRENSQGQKVETKANPIILNRGSGGLNT